MENQWIYPSSQIVFLHLSILAFGNHCRGSSTRRIGCLQDLLLFTADGIGGRPFRKEVVEELQRWQAVGSPLYS